MTRWFVVCGGNALARRLTRELIDRYDSRVTLIVGSDAEAADIADLEPESGDPALRPVVLTAPKLNANVFERAGLADAAAIALVEQDDVANVDAALVAREVSPTVRIVARMFNPVLGEGIAAILGDCAALSASEIAAPAFVAAALGADTPTYVRLPDQYLKVTRRDDVADPEDILCGLARLEGLTEPEILPGADDDADVVLVRSYDSPPRRTRRRRHPLRATRLLLGRNLRIVLAALAAVLAIATVIMAVVRHVGVWQAFYVSVLGSLGVANPDLGAPPAQQATEIVLSLVGIALIPAVTATVVEVVVQARLAVALGGLTEPVSDHVIVVGLGDVGTRVVQELCGLGVDVVAVDRSPTARGISAVRELKIPVIIGDAASAETLRAASVATCRALILVATPDVSNLETALLARAVDREQRERTDHPREADGSGSPGQLPVVLRLFDEEFAARVTRAFGIGLSRSVSYLAAPAFAAAMAGREVIDTVSVGRHVLLIAELPVGAGSQLEGRTCPEVSTPREARLVAVRTGRGRQTLWRPPDRRILVRTDRLLVVATRTGLASLLGRTAGVPNPPPLVEPELPALLSLHGSQPAERQAAERPRPGHRPPGPDGGQESDPHRPESGTGAVP